MEKNTSVSIYLDKELEDLHLEIKLVEQLLQQRTNEKAEIERIIHEFGLRYNRELGELIIEILKWRKDNANGTSFQEETQNDYNSFFNNYSSSKKERGFALTELQKQELKVKYRKASKICHPDIATDKQKERAHKVFTELNCAYEMNDLEKVKEILEALEQGEVFVNKVDSAAEKNVLQSQLKKLRIKISELESEINKLVSSETYVKIISIKNLDEYFKVTKNELQDQLNQSKYGRK
jgi:hypothetical protein